MTTDDLPLLVGRASVLVQDLLGDFELADVVDQRGPSELGRVLGLELHLLGDEVGVGADPFGVTPGHSIVSAQGSQLHEQLLGGFLRGAEQIVRPTSLDRVRQPSTRGGSQRETEAERGDAQHRRRERTETHEPHQQGTQMVDGSRCDAHCQPDRHVRHDERPGHGHDPNEPAQDRSRTPRALVQIQA